jgi:phosphatidylglycerol:prolipoprotein diacylglycerol transferase
MLPYLEQPVWQVGPLSIHAFGVAVAVAMWFGLVAVERRIERLGLDPLLGRRLGVWMILGGIAGAHLFSVLLYFPHKLRDDPWLLLRVWEDISSFGGLLGGIGGALLFFATRAPDVERRAQVAFLDVVAFVFPAALAIGRLGCALAHDHPGSVTTFYEFLFLALVVVPLFLVWDRRRRPVGFYVIAFAALYLPVRFCLDMLRVADVHYVGLTPAQWVAASILAALPFVAVRRRALRFAISGAVILAAGWACTGGGP